MPEFLIEVYVPRGDADRVEQAAERARLVAAQLAREGTDVLHLRAIFVPEDEICFHLYRAESAEAARKAAEHSALRCERISEAVLDGCGRAGAGDGGSRRNGKEQ